MNAPVRLGFVLLFLCLPPAAFLAGGWHSVATSARFDVSGAPQRLAGHVATVDQKLEAWALDVLEPDAYLQRHYRADDGSSAFLYTAFYSGYGTTGAHDPTICFPSQGWDLSRPHDREVQLPDGGSLIVNVFRAEQAGRAELVMYWFQPWGRWPGRSPVEPFRRVYEALAGRKRYAFVRLSIPVAGSQARDSESAEQLLISMAGDLAPWVRGALEGASVAAGERLPSTEERPRF